MKFGEYVKNRRIEIGMTLRSFCREAGFDASNWSKIERGVIPPPQETEALDCIAAILGLDADQRTDLGDRAAVARGQLPTDFKEDEIQAKLPAFFRAIRGQEYSATDVEELIEGVKKLHKP